MDSSVFSKYLLPVVIALIMFNLGLSLRFKDFKRTFTVPKSLIIGLCCQMLLLPAIAFGIAFFSGLPVYIQVGLVLIAACPGGATSNLITYWLKGDVALSISLTSVNSIFILFSIPAITNVALFAFLGEQSDISLPFLKTVVKILFMILLPTIIGIWVRRYNPRFASRLERFMKYITTLLLAVVFLFTILANKGSSDTSFKTYISIAPYALLLNLFGMLSGLIAGYLAGFSKQKIITLVIEVGIQNSALAITIASGAAFLNNPKMALPAVIYGMFTFFNAVIIGYIIKRWMHFESVE